MKRLFFLLLAVHLGAVCFAQVKVENLLTENLHNPICIDYKNPAFSWQLSGDRRGIMQSAYEVKVAANANMHGKPVWESGKVVSAVCHGPVCLLNVKLSDGSWLISGKNMSESSLRRSMGICHREASTSNAACSA